MSDKGDPAALNSQVPTQMIPHPDDDLPGDELLYAIRQATRAAQLGLLPPGRADLIRDAVERVLGTPSRTPRRADLYAACRNFLDVS